MKITITAEVFKTMKDGDLRTKITKINSKATIEAFPTTYDHQAQIPLLLEIEDVVKAKVAEINQRLASESD